MRLTLDQTSAAMMPLLRQCNILGRRHIADLAMIAMLETYLPEERHRVLTEAMQRLRLMLPEMEQD